MDLSLNPALYRDTGYQAKVPSDRTAFMAPVADARAANSVEASSGYPVELITSWAQPGPGMVDAILRRELATSGVFAGMSLSASPEGCVIQIALDQFEAGLREHPTGRQGFALVQLRVRVHGPTSAGGKRQLLLDRKFRKDAQTEVTMRPTSPRLLLGVALRSTVATMLAFLDQSNVARANVPLNGG